MADEVYDGAIGIDLGESLYLPSNWTCGWIESGFAYTDFG